MVTPPQTPPMGRHNSYSSHDSRDSYGSHGRDGRDNVREYQRDLVRDDRDRDSGREARDGRKTPGREPRDTARDGRRTPGAEYVREKSRTRQQGPQVTSAARTQNQGSWWTQVWNMVPGNTTMPEAPAESICNGEHMANLALAPEEKEIFRM
jgi:hypothetical protein